MATIKTEDAESLMKRCQIGVGGRGSLDTAHDILAECYGKFGVCRPTSTDFRKG